MFNEMIKGFIFNEIFDLRLENEKIEINGNCSSRRRIALAKY
jgi:hypothetical protein